MHVDIRESVLRANDEIAADLRRDFARRGVTVLNLIGSPGSGKTALLERTLSGLAGRVRAAVLVGDVETDADARRLAACGVPVHQIVTAGTCHLEAHAVARHLAAVDGPDLEVLLIENVGNLVCPASFDLGEDGKVVVLSVTEGEDKPHKYPAVFHRAIAAVITKVDLLPHLDYDLDATRDGLRRLSPQAAVFELSARTGEGLDPWLGWLEGRVRAKREAARRARA